MTEKIGLIAIFDTGQFNKGLSDYLGGVDKANSATQSAEKNSFSFTRALEVAVGNALVEVGKLAVAAGEALFDFGQESVDLAANFQTSMVNLKTAASDSNLSIEELGDLAIKVGADSNVLGASATGAADAMIEMYRAGLKDNAVFGDMEGYLNGTAELGGILKASFDLATASELDVAQAAELGVTALSVFGGELESDAEKGQFAADSMDYMVRAANASNAEVSDLAMALTYAGVNANDFGLSIEDTNIALGLLSNAGLKGSSAGTTLSAVMRDLKKETKESTAAWDEMGISIYDADTGATRPFIDILGDLEVALGDKTDAQKSAIMQDIFTSESMKGVNLLLAEGVTGWGEMSDAIDGATGMQEMAAAQSQTFAGQMEALDGQIETLKIQFGMALLPAITSFIETIIPIIEQYGPQLADVFEKVGTFLADLVAGFAEFISESGGLSGIWEKVKKSFEENDFIQGLIDKFKQFAATIGPILQRGISEVIDLWNRLKENIDIIWLGIQNVVNGAIDIIMGIVTTFTSMMAGDWSTMWEGIKQVAFGVWEAIQGIIMTAFGFILALVGTNAEQLFTTIAQLWVIIKTVTAQAWEAVKEFLTNAWVSISTTVSTAASAIWEYLTGVWENVKNVFMTVWGAISSFISSIWQTIQDIFTVALGYIAAVISGDSESAKQIITAAWEAVKNFLSETWENLKTWASETWENITTVASEKFEAFKTAAGEKWEAIKEGIKEKIKELKTALPIIWNSIKDTASEKFNDMLTAAKEKFAEIKTSVETKIEEVKTYLSGINLADIGTAMIQGLIDGIKGAAGSLADAAKGVVQGAIDAAKETLGIQSPSKVFAAIGVNTMLGMAQGINAASAVPQEAVTSAVGGMVSPVANSTVNNINNSRNIELNIANYGNNSGNRTYFDVVAGLQAVGV